MIEHMGFEKQNRRPAQSYGKMGHVLINGEDCRCASEAEAKWLEHISPALRSGDIVEFTWQPPGSPLHYKYDKQDCTDVYRPDAIIRWKDGDEWVIEIKRGRLEQKAASKIKRFCQQYPDRKLVLVWFGRLPSKGPAHTRLNHIRPWIDHIWEMK